jgi:hypothetical protein
MPATDWEAGLILGILCLLVVADGLAAAAGRIRHRLAARRGRSTSLTRAR